MSAEYNSILVSKLMDPILGEDEIIEILLEMEDIRDPSFLYPVFVGYKNNKINYISHYFVDAIRNIASPDVLPIMYEIGENPNIRSNDLSSVLEYFDKNKIYDVRAINVALNNFNSPKSVAAMTGFAIYSLVQFIQNAGRLADINGLLYLTFYGLGANTNIRQFALKKWIEIDPKKNIQNLIVDYDNIRNKNELDIIVAKTISSWTGPKSEELKSLILEKGGPQSKHIIINVKEKNIERQKKVETQKIDTIKQIYSNADLIEEISVTREKINEASKSSKLIGFPIFPQNETLAFQLKTASDEATLMKACVNLRELIQDLNPELGNHGMSSEDCSKKLPDINKEDLNKSINKLNLYLISKKYETSSDLLGLRKLNQIVGLMGAHPKKERQKLIEKLKEHNLESAYNNEDWGCLHRSLLSMYNEFLIKLHKLLYESHIKDIATSASKR